MTGCAFTSTRTHRLGRSGLPTTRGHRKSLALHIPGKGIDLHEAYAVVSRFYDPTTEQMTLVVAGKGKAILAAAEFVANPAYMEDFSKHAPPNWFNKNMQILIRANVVGGSPGPPVIAASYFW